MNDHPEDPHEDPHEALRFQRFTIDRFEDNGWAVLEREDGHAFNVPSEWLPDEAAEGDVLLVMLEGQGEASTLRFTLDHESRDVRLRNIEAIRSRLKRGPAGDLEL